MNKRLNTLISALIFLIVLGLGVASTNGVNNINQAMDVILFVAVIGIKIKVAMWVFQTINKAVNTVARKI